MNIRRVTRFDELTQSVPPARDLWPAIAAAIDADKAAAVENAPARRRSRWYTAGLPVAGMAAAIALVAIGVVIGLRLQPTPQMTAGTNVPAADAILMPAAMREQKYRTQRDALMVEVQNRLQSMAPAERAKVKASLETLKRSIADIETALGRDPANALLQELLVTSCQEEMRALTAVRDSGSQEI